VGTARDARQVLTYVWTHPANRRMRLRSVGRAVAFQIRGFLGRPTLTTIGTNTKMWAELHYCAASKVIYANPPDWPEMQAWRRIIKPGDLFVDVGSNIGSYALWAAEAGAEVIAIEPDPGAAARLRRNVALNRYPIKVVECALAAECGRMTLTTGNDTINHLLLDSGGPGTQVEVRTLDDIVGDRWVTGVKIDVEGAERLVLAGAQRALSTQRISVLQIEWNRASEALLGETRDSLVAMLHQHRYDFMRPDGDGRLRPTDPSGYGEDLFAVASTTLFRRDAYGLVRD
jgi:FkbM family methyltransferase